MSQHLGSGGAGLRDLNARQVLADLMDRGDAATVAELARAVGISRPTVEAALAEIGSWVVEVAPEPTPNRAGRRARRHRFDTDAGRVMGIDIGPHAVSCLLADLGGGIVHAEELSYDDHGDAGTAWQAIRSVVERAFAAAGSARMLATTVGIPAIVRPDGTIAYSVVVPGWLRAGIPSLISSEFASEATFFDNDVKLATLAEAEWGALEGAQHAMFLLAGQQIGLGVVVAGQLVRGAHGAAGEIGGLEHVNWASAPQHFAAAFDPGTPFEAPFVAAREGDPAAAAAVAVFARDIATGVAAAVLTVDPDVIVVGGEAAHAGDAFIDPLRRSLAGLCLSSPRIQLSMLGGRAVARGALARSLGHVRETLLSTSFG
jgi:predicted NBD/HSP70 family sugar kinase